MIHYFDVYEKKMTTKVMLMNKYKNRQKKREVLLAKVI